MPDGNKTQLTREVTSAVNTWLTERGFKPVETEVPCGDKWVADLASFCYPTRTEAQQMKLIPKKPAYRVDGWRERHERWEAEYDALPAPLTAIVEVKTTASDLARDGKFCRTIPVHLAYMAVPVAIVNRALDCDRRWGVLRHDKSGNLTCVRQPALQKVELQATVDIIAAIAIRRHHFTAYKRDREFRDQCRNNDNDRITRQRVSSVVDMVLAVLDGMPPEEAVSRHLRTSKLPSRQMEKLSALRERSGDV